MSQHLQKHFLGARHCSKCFACIHFILRTLWNRNYFISILQMRKLKQREIEQLALDLAARK